MTLRGDAGFKYTDPSDGVTTVTVALQAPLRDISPAQPAVRFQRWSLDLTSRDVVTVGSTTITEITASLRYETDVDGLRALLQVGLDGTTLTYYPSLADTATSYPCQLVDVSGGDQVVMEPDADLWFQRRLEARLRLRRVDGGNFDALIDGT